MPVPSERHIHLTFQKERHSLILGIHTPTDKFPGLAQLLPRVAMEDRTVIITSVNEAWARPGSLLDIYRESFKNGEDTEHLLNHVLIVALDPTGFGRCNVVHPYCYLLEVKTANLTSATRFMSKEYLELVWSKLSFQQRVLELGYNFLYTDTDMIMMRNPLRHIPVYADMSVSTDNFLDARVPLTNPLNTGLYYMKATNRSISMLRYWQEARPRFPRLNDQPVFARIKHELVEKLQVRIEPLRTIYFGGFCQYHDDFDKISIMHADCCIGVDNKVHDLMDVAADWKRYRSLTRKKKRNMNVKLTWTVPVRCRKSIHRRKPVRRH
ncbi:uncharacterized protein At4g15970 isoform X2 [Brachypodium distachyon]|uniref:Nucleotide-diphospho-sugar transferase domain-containing protein n=1 Tax=Brachypodium distachyon TaxID=15368 RepID=A0A2K2DGS6_BRADI|nr:uncharacterized protein At4g15970 isoform X2 [Brachypodium distachyon]PNT73480.1 hypothetical protein BRADI_2g59001v3 [Brachypodium distachyon]|eukprot:XP_024316014.1 uncharacterized protein At4g15970 isoform X2 [Brachypodium distachyon]